MSEAYSRESGIVTETGVLGQIATVPIIIALGMILLGGALLFQWVSITTTVAGVSVATVFGGLHVVIALSLFLIGFLSWQGSVDTTPSPSVSSVVAFIEGSIAAVIVGLVVSQTFGMGWFAWIPAAVIAGVAVFVGTLLLREDLGITIPVGIFELVFGLVVLTGVIGSGWSWTPEGFSATLPGFIAIAILGLFGGLLTAWSSAAAYRGFGARGREFGAYVLISINTAILLFILARIILFIVQKGLDPMLKGATLWPPAIPFITNGNGLQYDINGIFPAVVGTIWLVIGAICFAVPLGVGAAVYLTEYAEQGRFTSIVEIATNGLWSTPSIIFGLFGYAFLVPRLGNTPSLLAGQVVLGAMLLPLVLITSRESLQNVPDEYRDASAALGVNQWETIKSVVLPAAVPGVLTGVILGVGRIAGETAPILLILVQDPFPSEAPKILSSFTLQPTPPFIVNDALLQPASALPYQLFAVITAGVSAPESVGWATALVLLIVVLSFYVVGITMRIYFRRKLQQ